jgi:hypothetical protein
MAVLPDLAMADGMIAGNEQKLLQIYREKFGISEQILRPVIDAIAVKNDFPCFSGLFLSRQSHGLTGTDLPGLEPAADIHHHPDRHSPFTLPHPVIVDLPHMAQTVPGKIVPREFEECQLMAEERFLKRPGLPRYPEGLVPRDVRMVASVFVKTAYLAPVDDPMTVWLTVKHKGVHPADHRPVIVDPAPSILQEKAGPCGIMPGADGVSGYVECPVQVTESIGECRLQGRGIVPANPFCIVIEEMDMAVECPGTAPGAEIAGKSDLLNDIRETVFRIPAKRIEFLPASQDQASEGFGK